jgi:preprotein translocase subunit SecG
MQHIINHSELGKIRMFWFKAGFLMCFTLSIALTTLVLMPMGKPDQVSSSSSVTKTSQFVESSKAVTYISALGQTAASPTIQHPVDWSLLAALAALFGLLMVITALLVVIIRVRGRVSRPVPTIEPEEPALARPYLIYQRPNAA